MYSSSFIIIINITFFVFHFYSPYLKYVGNEAKHLIIVGPASEFPTLFKKCVVTHLYLVKICLV